MRYALDAIAYLSGNVKGQYTFIPLTTKQREAIDTLWEDLHSREPLDAANLFKPGSYEPKDLPMEPSESALDAVFERIRREGYCCPSCGCDSLRHAGEPKRDIMAMERNALENVLAVLNRAATEVSRHSERDKGFHTGVVFAKSLLEAAQHDEETSGNDS